MTRVLIAVDGSDLDDRLGDVAVDLFGGDAALFAVNVGDLAPPVLVPIPSPGFAFGYAVARVDGRLEPTGSAPIAATEPETDSVEAARHVAAISSPDEATPVGEVGDPAEAIVRVAADLQVDVVVVGARDRSWLSRLLDPSVSANVIRRSEVPVLVVHDPPPHSNDD